jgi:cell division transport system ATP-binding protein
MISFNNVTKAFGPHLVLDEVNFEIDSNELIILNGISGAGKSTVVGLLIGADKPTSGTVEVDGILVNDMDGEMLQLYRRKVGVVYQDYKLLPAKTVFENVAFAMEVCEAPNDVIQQRVPELLAKVGLAQYSDHFPEHLSGGEKQRLAIARALVHDPRLLIADEPTGNLDEENVRGILDLFRKLHAEGATILLTTHDPLVHQLMPGRTITLVKGKIN